MFISNDIPQFQYISTMAKYNTTLDSKIYSMIYNRFKPYYKHECILQVLDKKDTII